VSFSLNQLVEHFSSSFYSDFKNKAREIAHCEKKVQKRRAFASLTFFARIGSLRNEAHS
jgi:hypothetical protein